MFLIQQGGVRERVCVFVEAGFFKMIETDHTPLNFLKAVLHKIYLVHSWILCPN